ncbi:unnamed protein product [Allacma fusca]|uniref:CCR4-Not complex component Not N-terminal domain-containing protein n=1 Tax=Allacma fusca TaxID=39272 RepID=A0A8J2LN98_9HEXA|nr:unnamed protein product [Allacma fusca]
MKPETKLISILSRPVQFLRRSLKSKSKNVKEARSKRKAGDYIKKSSEVVARFDKVYLNTSTPEDKSKSHNPELLKKDIKKLLLLKNQIKDGTANGIWKDPKLLDSRRQVESCLSRVKVIEKQWNLIAQKNPKCDSVFTSLLGNQTLSVQKKSREDNEKLCEETSFRPAFLRQSKKQKRIWSKSIVATVAGTSTGCKKPTPKQVCSKLSSSAPKHSIGGSVIEGQRIHQNQIETNSEKLENASCQLRKTDAKAETNPELDKVQSWLASAISNFQRLISKYDDEIKSILTKCDEKAILKLNARSSMHTFQMRKLEKLSESIKNLPRDVKNLQNFFSLIQQTKSDIEKYLKKSNEELVTLLNDIKNARLEILSDDTANAELSKSEMDASAENPAEPGCEERCCNVMVTFTCSGVSVSSPNGSEFSKSTTSTSLSTVAETIFESLSNNYTRPGARETETAPLKKPQFKIPMRGTSRRSRIINRLSANPKDAQFLLSRRRMLERRESQRPRILKLKQQELGQVNSQRKNAPSASGKAVYLPMVSLPAQVVP